MAAPPLDQFEFCRNIGKGSYGEVTLARHKRDRKQYVLKKINLKKASTRERKSAEQEAKLLSRLKHPNIVSYKDSFEREGFLYIAMQYCEGGDLYNKLKEQRGTLLEERQLVEWFVQIAMALQYMHERNILHRDLKTQNIFLTKSKIIKVGDLGIARVLDSSSDMATTLIGTPYYMSPELFSNKPYNHKSDVWALGCCVYEMMTLKHAFNAKDMNSLVYKILRGKMPPMPKQYSTDLVGLLRSMLHQDPNKRPTVNKILRDPYIKKNIAIFLEETKQSRRPSSAVKSRPSSAGSQRSVSSVGSAASSRSRVSEQSQGDEPDSSRSSVPDSSRSTASVSQVEVGPAGDVIQAPVPVARQQYVNHRRSPSDGIRPALDPIIENQPVVAVEDDDSGEDTLKAKTVKDNKPKDVEPPKPPSPTSSPPRAVNAKRKKKSVLSKYARPDSDRSDAGSGPKPVDKPRPLPIPPKQDSQGLPQRRVSDYDDNNPSPDSQSKSSSSSSKEDNMALDDLTPRSLPNMSARERRRRKENNAQSYDRPHSARVKLVDSSKSTVITNSERRRYEDQKAPVRHRQPSIADDSSSSDEGTLKESEVQRHNKEKNRRLHSLPLSNGHDTPPTSSHRKHIHQHSRHVAWANNTPPSQIPRKHSSHHRENKEMNNFISLLDNTLQLNKDDDKSDEEAQEIPEVKVVTEETPRIPKSSSMPSVDTLCNHDRLMARIKLLHADCIKGVGWNVLKQAYEILGRIEEDEVEPKLVNLMGKENFDLYAGKIWQLKFCEDMARIGLPS